MHNYEVAKADVDSTTSTSCFLPTMDRGLHNIDGCWHIIAYSLQILIAPECFKKKNQRLNEKNSYLSLNCTLHLCIACLSSGHPIVDHSAYARL